jgi:hypothetical protein
VPSAAELIASLSAINLPGLFSPPHLHSFLATPLSLPPSLADVSPSLSLSLLLMHTHKLPPSPSLLRVCASNDVYVNIRCTRGG